MVNQETTGKIELNKVKKGYQAVTCLKPSVAQVPSLLCPVPRTQTPVEWELGGRGGPAAGRRPGSSVRERHNESRFSVMQDGAVFDGWRQHSEVKGAGPETGSKFVSRHTKISSASRRVERAVPMPRMITGASR